MTLPAFVVSSRRDISVRGAHQDALATRAIETGAGFNADHGVNRGERLGKTAVAVAGIVPSRPAAMCEALSSVPTA